MTYAKTFWLAVKYRADGIKDGTSSIELIYVDLRLWLIGKLTNGDFFWQ